MNLHIPTLILILILPIHIPKRSFSLLIQLIQPRQLFQKPSLIERTQQHLEALPLIRLEHRVAARRAPRVRRTFNLHRPELGEVAPQLVRHEPEDAARGVWVGQVFADR